MKDRLKIYSTKNLNQNLINKIIKLKSTHWKNSLSNQRKWFKKNLFKNDIHIILENKKIVIGYVALRKRIFYYDKNIKYLNQILLFDTLIIINYKLFFTCFFVMFSSLICLFLFGLLKPLNRLQLFLYLLGQP